MSILIPATPKETISPDLEQKNRLWMIIQGKAQALFYKKNEGLSPLRNQIKDIHL